MTLIVRMEHIRQAKMCSGGTRSFFQRHGMDWTRFLAEGLPAEDFLKTGDAMAAHVVDIARASQEGTGGRQ